MLSLLYGSGVPAPKQRPPVEEVLALHPELLQQLHGAQGPRRLREVSEHAERRAGRQHGVSPSPARDGGGHAG